MNEDTENYTRLDDAEKKDEGSWFPNLTLKQRFGGMIACGLLGFLINMLSYIVLFTGNKDRKVIAYALLYTFGNTVTVLGTCFLWGFKAQFKAITHKHRIAISCVYFGAMLLTLIVAFTVEDPLRKLLLVLLIMVQYTSYIWYALSYVPFARAALKTFFRGIIG